MKTTNTVAKLFSSVSTLAVVACAMAFNGTAWGQTGAVIVCSNIYTDLPASFSSGVSASVRNVYDIYALKNGAVLGCYSPNGIPASANSGVTAIAASNGHTIALKNGEVLAWGDNNYGQCTIPAAALSGVTAIAGGGLHTIALKDGAVLAWGRNDFSTGQCNIPASANSGVTAIAGGYKHTIALKDGAVLAWGYNGYGQCNIPAAALSGVTAIASGDQHTIALKDGAVLAWGYNGYGQCNIPNAALSGVTAIASGCQPRTIALKNGEVLAWGNNSRGECLGTNSDGIPITTTPTGAPLQILGQVLTGVSAIANGYESIIAIKVTDPNDPDGDGIPNATDNCPRVKNPTQADCDGNGVGDACELDCNHNSIADVCEILSGAVTDQNLNGIPDTCEVSSVTRVQPISGPSTGGTAVRIIGTNFFSALPVSVTFGGAPATDVVVVSLTEITAVTPSGSPGDTVVTVNSASAEAFYYRPSCDGDLDNNGTIDSSDLGLLLINMGDCSSSLTTPQEQEPMIFQSVETPTPVLNKK